MRHLLSLMDWTSSEIQEVLELTRKVKRSPEKYRDVLRGKTLAMIFQKSSTRTRVSFEVGVYQLGGLGLHLSSSDLQMGRGETIPDTARVLSRYVDGIMARVFAHDHIVELARYSRVPVINGLSDLLHPCQALADYFTILEHRGSLKGVRVAYIGDGNNVAHSLINGASKLGIEIVVATPPDYGPDPGIVSVARQEAEKTGGRITLLHNPREAAKDADVIYTDVWTSMGQEAESERRRKAFAGYQVDMDMIESGRPGCLFMHCLPAHRGEEVTHAVMESTASVVFDEAENRLHAQKAVMILLMENCR
jgi:ornithine carbamoyltransferase